MTPNYFPTSRFILFVNIRILFVTFYLKIILLYWIMISKNRPSKVSTNFLDQLVKILSFSPSKTRRETTKQKRNQRI